MLRSAILSDLYEFTMAGGYFDQNWMPLASFELFIRDLPRNRNYLMVAGLEQVLEYLEGWRFTDKDIKYLKSHPALSHLPRDFFTSLREMNFTGDVWAMPEGTLAFSNEPIIRVTAPIIQAQLLETYILSMITYQTMVATKASRVVHAARGRSIIEFGARRAHSPAASLWAARASYIGGCTGTSNTLAGERFGIPTYGTQAHSWIMAFYSELEAFKKYYAAYPDSTILLIDTYDTKRGIHKAVQVSKNIRGVRLDSGNMVSLSKYCRTVLDDNNMKKVKIVASGNLDEYKIDRMLKHGATIDIFGVGTEMVTSGDAPSLNSAYKLVAVNFDGQEKPVLKLSRFKESYAGPKQVFRRIKQNGIMLNDILGCADEPIPAAYKPLLKRFMKRGKRVGSPPPLSKIRRHAIKELDSLPSKYLNLYKHVIYPVRLSTQLKQISQFAAEEARNA